MFLKFSQISAGTYVNLTCLKADADDPFDEAVVGPHKDVFCSSEAAAAVALSPLRFEMVAVKVDQLQALDAELQRSPVEAVYEFELRAQVLLGQVVQHAGIH